MKFTKKIVYQVTTLNLGGCFTATLPIYNCIVSIPLEAVTLEPLFRWIPNLPRLCLATRGNSLVIGKCEIVMSFSFVTKTTFSEQNLKNPHLVNWS